MFPPFLVNSFRVSIASQDRKAKLFLCLFHSLDGFYRLDSSQHSEIDGIGHCFVADRARVQIVAGVIPITKTRWMVGIAHSLIKIEVAVSCAAGPDPLIDRHANRLPRPRCSSLRLHKARWLR